jgi:hypothetical protein
VTELSDEDDPYTLKRNLTCMRFSFLSECHD